MKTSLSFCPTERETGTKNFAFSVHCARPGHFASNPSLLPDHGDMAMPISSWEQDSVVDQPRIIEIETSPTYIPAGPPRDLQIRATTSRGSTPMQIRTRDEQHQ